VTPRPRFSILGRPPALRAIPVLALAMWLLGGCGAIQGAASTVAGFPSKVSATVGNLFSPAGDAAAAAEDPDLIVLPLADTEWAGRKAVAEELTRVLRSASPRVRMGERADGRAQTLAGRIETLEAGGPVAWIEIRWLHHHGDGRLIAEHRQIAAMDRDMWDKVQPAGVRLLASEIAPKIAGALREGGPLLAARSAAAGTLPGAMEIASNTPTASPAAHSQVYQNVPQAAPPPVAPPREIAAAPVAPVQGSPLSTAWTNPIVLVRSVDGAPGDGNVALMLAIKQSLKVRDFMVTEDPRQAIFLIDG